MNKKLLVIGIPFILIIGLLSTYLTVHSPKHSARAIIKAFENRDWELFSKYVDVKNILESLLTKSTEDVDPVTRGLIGTMVGHELKKSTISILKAQIEQPKSENYNGYFKPIMELKNALSKAKVKKKGKMCDLCIPKPTTYLNLKVDVILSFREEGMHYVLININTSRYDSAEIEIEKILSWHYILPVRDSINKMITITTMKKYEKCTFKMGESCVLKDLMIQNKITNNTNRAIKEIFFDVIPSQTWRYFTAKGFTIGTTVFLNPKRPRVIKNIGPLQTKIVGKNKGWFIGTDEYTDYLFHEAKLKDIAYIIRRITFKDGSSIKESENLYLERIKTDKVTLKDILNRRKEHGMNTEFIVNPKT